MCKKRQLWVRQWVVLLIICLVVIQAEAYGNSWEWELFLKDTDSDFYYDPDTLTRSVENTVKVWWKEVFKTKDVLKSRGFKRSEYQKAAYQINVTEINCKSKAYNTKFFMLCSGEGESIFCTIHRKRSDEWIPVREDHATGALYWKLCK